MPFALCVSKRRWSLWQSTGPRVHDPSKFRSLLSVVCTLSHVTSGQPCRLMRLTVPTVQVMSVVPGGEGPCSGLWCQDSCSHAPDCPHLPGVWAPDDVTDGFLGQLCFSLTQGHDHVVRRLRAALESSHWEKCLPGEWAWREGESPRICSASEGWGQRSGGMGFVLCTLRQLCPLSVPETLAWC